MSNSTDTNGANLHKISTNPVAAVAPLPTVKLFGVPISQLNMMETVKYLAAAIEARKPNQVITANPIMIMTALEHPEYLTMMQQADLIVPDGTGVVWAANYVGAPVKERVPGFDLLHRLLAYGEEQSWKVYLLGASTEIIETSYQNLKQQYPGIQFVGYRDGFFGKDQDLEVIEHIRQVEPDLLFVGRSQDKQEPWIHQYREKLNIPVMMGVGGSFDVISGKLKRAPAFFIKMRLEWFYRLLQEPWRYKRMLALPKFALKVIREKEKALKS